MMRNILCLLFSVFCLAQIAVAQTEVVPAAATRNYQVGPGDVITARVLGESEFDFKATVDENGNIEIPFMDEPVSVMCHSEGALKTEIGKLLSKYLRSPRVSLDVERRSRPPVTVSGKVRNTQPVMLTRKTRLLELISFSGGITEDAGGMIQVFRLQPPLCAEPDELADWKAEAANTAGANSRMYSYKIVQQGKEESNPLIYPGDIIVVLEANPVYIVGEVRAGQGLMLKEGGLRLTQAIAMVGGVNSQAKTKDIKIYRRKTDSIDSEILSVNLDQIKKGQQKDMPLEPYDIVEVGKAKEGIGNIILKTITGGALGGASTLITGGAARILY